MNAPTDPIVDWLGDAHRTIVAAGKLYVAGERERAAVEVDDAIVVLREARALLRRAIEQADA
ncbi:MAG TPA: hypothetical protein VIL77_04065 [Gaiellaceae bacterium]